MRALFDDELLVRKKYGYELTPKAESIKDDINTKLGFREPILHSLVKDGRHECLRYFF